MANQSFLLIAGFVASCALPLTRAATYEFSFSNVDGAVAGTVSGIITLPDGDGVFAASAVTILEAPSLGFSVPQDAMASGVIQNSFSVVSGEIDPSASSFLGVINSYTAFSLRSSFASFSSFLDQLNGSDYGASGVRDIASATLAYSSGSAIPEPGSAALLAGFGMLVFAGTRRRRAAA